MTTPTDDGLLASLKALRVQDPKLGRAKVLEKLKADNGCSLSDKRLKVVHGHAQFENPPNAFNCKENVDSAPSLQLSDDFINAFGATHATEVFNAGAFSKPPPKKPTAHHTEVFNLGAFSKLRLKRLKANTIADKNRVKGDLDNFCTNPYGSIFRVLYDIGYQDLPEYPERAVQPINLCKRIKKRGIPHKQTIYTRPALDILYIPDLWTLDLSEFMMDDDNDLTIPRLATTPVFIMEMTESMETEAGIIAADCFSLKEIYIFEGETFGDEWKEDRSVMATFVMKDKLQKGPMEEKDHPKWNTGFAKTLQDRYKQVTEDSEEELEDDAPKLICREIERVRTSIPAFRWPPAGVPPTKLPPSAPIWNLHPRVIFT